MCGTTWADANTLEDGCKLKRYPTHRTVSKTTGKRHTLVGQGVTWLSLAETGSVFYYTHPTACCIVWVASMQWRPRAAQEPTQNNQ